MPAIEMRKSGRRPRLSSLSPDTSTIMRFHAAIPALIPNSSVGALMSMDFETGVS